MKKLVFTLKSGKCIAQTLEEKVADDIFKNFENFILNENSGSNDVRRVYISKPDRKERVLFHMNEIAAIQEEVASKNSRNYDYNDD